MVNLEEVYRHAERPITAWIIAAFAATAGLIVLQTFLSPFLVMALLASVLFVWLALWRPIWVVGFLAIYLPLESVLLKFVPDEVYLFARYFPEGLIYLLAIVLLTKLAFKKIRFRPSPMDSPLALFILILVASAAINAVSPSIAVLGMRQILRFVLLVPMVMLLQPSKFFIRRLTIGLFIVAGLEAILGLLQAVFGAPLDLFLLPADAPTFR